MSFQNKTNVMIDLETLSTRPNAAIVQIGAVKFSFETGEIIDTFNVSVDPIGQKKLGLHVDPDTVKWWSEQPKGTCTWMKNQILIVDALTQFKDWFGKKSLPTWSLGAAFDQPVLESAYAIVLGQHTPWKYWDGYCCRTVLNMAGYDLKTEREASGTYHDALDDAKAQMGALLKVLRG